MPPSKVWDSSHTVLSMRRQFVVDRPRIAAIEGPDLLRSTIRDTPAGSPESPDASTFGYVPLQCEYPDLTPDSQTSNLDGDIEPFTLSSPSILA